MATIKQVRSREVRIEVGKDPTPQDLVEAVAALRTAAMEHFGDDGWKESVSFVYWDPRNPDRGDRIEVIFWAREMKE